MNYIMITIFIIFMIYFNEEKKHENKDNQLNLPGTAAKGKSV